MSEQNNNQNEVCETKNNSEAFKTGIKIAIGILLVIIGIATVIVWWPALVTVFKGCIGLFLIMVGAITIAIAKE